MSRTLRLLTVAAVGIGGALVMPAAAHAVDPVPPAPPAVDTVVTLPIPGGSVILTLTMTPEGNLDNVAVDPASQALTPTKVRSNKVQFVNDASGTQVLVNTKHGTQGVATKAGSLADLVGKGSWSGDVFGTGAATKVSFEITSTGTPPVPGINLATGDITLAAGVLAEVLPPVVNPDGEHGATARASVKFTDAATPTKVRILNISVNAGGMNGDDDDEADPARVSVRLGQLNILPTALVPGVQKPWTGTLCPATPGGAGAPASIAYSIDANGVITLGDITPATADTKVNGHSARIRFGKNQQVTITVHGAGHDGHDGADDEQSSSTPATPAALTVSVDAQIRCEGKVIPKVNGSQITVPQGANNKNGNNNGGGRNESEGKGGSGH